MKNDYIKLITVSAIAYASLGIFAPAWYLFLSQKGGTLQFGLVLGITTIAGGLTSYFIGRISDNYSKPFILSLSYFLLALVVFSYTFISSFFVIYIIQFLYGATSASIILTENVLVSINTPEEKRGSGMGLFTGMQQVIIGLCMILGGWIAAFLGVNNVFIIVGSMLLLGSLISTGIKK